MLLYLLTWLINQSTSFTTIRFLGGPIPHAPSFLVLAYFAAAGLVNSLVLLFAPVYHTKLGILSRWNARAHFADDAQVHEWFGSPARLTHSFDWIVPVLFGLASARSHLLIR